MLRLITLLGLVAFVVGGTITSRVPFPDGRIVGGEDADISTLPYQVSVRLFDSHICGGTILNANTILTAAHCIYNINARYYSIQYGVTKLGTYENVIVAEEITKHESYNSNTIDYDVAVIKLSEPIAFGPNAQPIALATEDPAAGSKAIVSGWGTTAENGYSSNILQKVVVEIVARADCNTQYKSYNQITDRMICAGVEKGGKDACQGDSGGPLVVDNKITGIVSWGVGCARPDFAGVYSNVAELRDWIEGTIQKQQN